MFVKHNCAQLVAYDYPTRYMVFNHHLVEEFKEDIVPFSIKDILAAYKFEIDWAGRIK
jgi:hypothetical protein